MDARIISFIESQTTMTLCTTGDGSPYCASCFYAFMKEEGCLVFKSSLDTRHIKEALQSGTIAGTILPDVRNISKVKGIQFTGSFSVPAENFLGKAGLAYYTRFPLALGMPGELFIARLDFVKMTDNTLGFGKKLVWNRPSQKNKK